MASEVEFDEGSDATTKGSMWVLEQKLDQPMDEEAGRLKNMYREKVNRTSSSSGTGRVLMCNLLACIFILFPWVLWEC